jgi:hypothetical protein
VLEAFLITLTKAEAQELPNVAVLHLLESWLDEQYTRLEIWGADIGIDTSILDVMRHSDRSGLHKSVSRYLVAIYETLAEIAPRLNRILRYGHFALYVTCFDHQPI